ncbi:lyso-ornithine lipid acyltransferase [Loktanella fryxellensis]|uniref:Lyso-ornithine lipid acyltransferase n=1 Tax=Loktanella fryxellensis TaxID=245187 RepID=A0A1H8F2N8_9RHOB|nr:lysophospholipid acyltransferase family protein [Loktanella fryxellensis]SEN26161.1 lyso-ornithine lipid acyltransferase [Loktanella fryxellensis]
MLRRAVPMVAVIFGGLIAALLLRPLERLRHGDGRPWTAGLTVGVCRVALRLLGLKQDRRGTPLQSGGAWVANHVSWLDILVLNAGGRVVFVSKAEVARWPGIGWLARATGTVFVTRDRRAAAADVARLRSRLAQGQVLMFFPEGTSTDGLRVLPFKPTLLAPLIAAGLPVQAVTLTYRAPAGADPRIYGWWGDMDLGPHLLATLAHRRQGTVTVTYHAPRPTTPGDDRKDLAHHLMQDVKSAL